MTATTTLARLVATLPLAGLLAAAPAEAATTTYAGVLAECGTDDALVADFTTRETGRTRSGDVEMLHLKLTGTITRTGTGKVGSYMENQRDEFRPDGSERYTGILSKLQVRGGGGYTWAGQADLPAGAEPRITHGLAPLMDADFAAVVCDALA
jgi:hypothetical protein